MSTTTTTTMTDDAAAPPAKRQKKQQTALPTLKEVDPEMYALIEKEEERQYSGLELIASENFTSRAVFECLGSCLTNKYSEGLPGRRYYGGNKHIDGIENLCRDRSLAAYGLDPNEWGVNVQPYSGSTANFAAYNAILKPHDRIMGLDLPSGGHLTHGFYTAKKKISATSIYFESLPYKVSSETGYIDYDKLEENAKLFRPKLIIGGASAYPREWQYERLRKIADAVGAYLLFDMAHISGLVATKVVDSPFAHCHIVTTTTHKSLRGPRAGVIFFRKDKELGFEKKVNDSVFPALQGGPHNNTIAGVAVQMKEVQTEEFKVYAAAVRKNCEAMGKALVAKGYTLATGGTDNHLILWNLRPEGISGSKMDALCDEVHITLNKNSIHGDKSAMNPGGVRVGSPALTSRGLDEKDFETVAGFLDRAVQLCKELQTQAGTKKLKAFKEILYKGNDKIAALKEEVQTFARGFHMPGFDTTKYRKD